MPVGVWIDDGRAPVGRAGRDISQFLPDNVVEVRLELHGVGAIGDGVETDVFSRQGSPYRRYHRDRHETDVIVRARFPDGHR